MELQEFDHISKCCEYLDQFKTLEELKEHLEDLPSKFGSFEIINEDTYKEDGCFEICNSYWDENVGDYDYDYHTIPMED